jgi:RNA polymerase sigma-70 factor (ECF subfamily)
MAVIFSDELIPAFHENNQEAVLAAFREHFSAMLQYAHQLTNDQPEAEEIVVGTFIKLIAMRRNFKTAADVKAFLLVTIRNGCYGYLSSLEAERPSKKDLLVLSDLKPDPDPATGAPVPFTTDMIITLYDGIQKLDTEPGEVFKLLFYNRMTVKDIAVQLGMPVKTVRASKAKAIKLLRALLTNKSATTPSH